MAVFFFKTSEKIDVFNSVEHETTLYIPKNFQNIVKIIMGEWMLVVRVCNYVPIMIGYTTHTAVEH